jgi:hypothetical protein
MPLHIIVTEKALIHSDQGLSRGSRENSNANNNNLFERCRPNSISNSRQSTVRDITIPAGEPRHVASW